MRAERIVDFCHLCGQYKLLSFEHVPPQAAYNHFPRFRPDTRQFIEHRYQGGPEPTLVDEPRGAGAYTLCVECNTRRCARYATHFVDWAVPWQTSLDSDPAATSIQLSQHVYRSRIMKQIGAMFLSANPPTGELPVALRRYVWNAETTGLPDGFHVYAALTGDKTGRQSAIGGKVSTDGSEPTSVYSEIAFAPMVLQLTVENSLPTDARLIDISFMATASYKERLTTQLELSLVKLRDFHPGSYG